MLSFVYMAQQCQLQSLLYLHSNSYVISLPFIINPIYTDKNVVLNSTLQFIW